MESIYVSYGWVGAVTAIVAAKWAMELGMGQVRQFLWAVIGFALPPLALLALYVRFLHERAPGHPPNLGLVPGWTEGRLTTRADIDCPAADA